MIKVARGVFAICLLFGGFYWFLISAQAWQQEDFIILTNGETGKTAISGMLFSIVFMLYGAWEMFKLVHKNVT